MHLLILNRSQGQVRMSDRKEEAIAYVPNGAIKFATYLAISLSWSLPSLLASNNWSYNSKQKKTFVYSSGQRLIKFY